MSIDKEIEFYKVIHHLRKTYGTDFFKWYWTPAHIKEGLPMIPPPDLFKKDIAMLKRRLKNPRKATKEDIEMYNTALAKKIEALDFKFDENLSKYKLKHQQYAFMRYYLGGFLTNATLSVCPKIKKKWNINFEVFGSFYNTHNKYCSFFYEIEKCKCDFFSFVPKPKMNILMNPPYTTRWIRITANIIDKYMKTPNLKIYYVVPVWNKSDREILKLKEYNDLPVLDELKKSKYLVSHEITRLDFYDGIIKACVNLTDPVHVYVFDNNKNLKNK